MIKGPSQREKSEVGRKVINRLVELGGEMNEFGGVRAEDPKGKMEERGGEVINRVVEGKADD